VSETGDVAGTLESEGGTHQGGQDCVIPMAFDLQQITSKANRSQPKEAYSPTLNQAGQMMVAYGGNNTQGAIDIATACNAHGSRRYDFESETFVAYGFSQERDGSTVRNAENLARPVTGRHGDPGIVVFDRTRGTSSGDISAPLRACGAATEGVNDAKADTQCVAFDTTQITSPGNYSSPKDGDPCHPLASGAHPPAIAFTERSRAQGRTLEAQDDLAYALTNPGSGGRTHSRQIAGPWGVRRLTPTECERLQGFPDGWTEGQSDSARYRQLGNAVCVPVAEWIGKRLLESAR